MLLPSHRHKPDDLELWADLEEADLAHYVASDFGRKIKRSHQEIADFAADGPCYAAVSWGKDSLVLAHLIACFFPDIPVGRVNQCGPGEDPYIADVRDHFLSRHKLDYHEESVLLEVIPDDGGHSPALDIGIKGLQKRFGTVRYIGGVRASESGTRKIGMRIRGLSTEQTCQPIGWWSTADVFAYLAHHRLPIHPSYGMLGAGRWDRQRLRVSTIGGPKGNQFGRREWEEEYYGDVLRRMRK